MLFYMELQVLAVNLALAKDEKIARHGDPQLAK